jgi:hypothetical protein
MDLILNFDPHTLYFVLSVAAKFFCLGSRPHALVQIRHVFLFRSHLSDGQL